jgi:hypothetical protein
MNVVTTGTGNDSNNNDNDRDMTEEEMNAELIAWSLWES